MFGFGNSTPEPAPQPGFPGSGMGNPEEKIMMATTILAMNNCQQQTANLHECTQRNGIRDGDERAVQQKCGGELQQLTGCMQNVDEEQVMGAMLGIAGGQCPSQMRDLQSCISSNSSNPQACERQYIGAMECAADFIISEVEKATNQLQSRNQGMW